MTLPKNETGIPDSIVGTGSTVTHKRYSVFRIFLLTAYLVGLRRSFARIQEGFHLWHYSC